MKNQPARVIAAVLFVLLPASACSPAQRPQVAIPIETQPTNSAAAQAPTPSPLVAVVDPPTSAEAPTPFVPTFTPTLSPTEITAATQIEATLAPPAATLEGTPTETSIPVPRIPLDTLYVVRPGQASKVVSPIKLEAFVMTGETGLVKIELFGEDGRVINRQILRYTNMNQGVRFQIMPEIEYEIPTVSEIGRLVISISDKQNRTIALTSIDLVLLSIGETEINPSGDLLAPFYIQSPHDDQPIRGGTLTVSGWMRPLSDQPVIFELTSDQGQLMISKQIEAVQDSQGGYVPFEVEFPYSVSKWTYARLSVRQTGGRIAGDITVESVKVYLSP